MHQVHSYKDQQINELSDMVKELMKEQQELKQQLNRKDHLPGLPRPKTLKPNAGLNKKSSERVPRKETGSDYQHVMALEDNEQKNPRDFLDIPLQVKPGERVNPKDNAK
jgi:hypothetical protein